MSDKPTNSTPQPRESYDVLAWPKCECVRLHGAICEDCQRDIIAIRNRPHHEGEHYIVARRQVEEWQRLEDAALEFWACPHKGEPCECSLPLGWAVVGLQLERGEIVEVPA
jgi:hypothetical protein